MSVKVSCPGCGGPIEFKIGSAIVAICPYCRSAVARGDRNVEDLGKVAALADTDSQLEMGLEGKYQGVKFTLTGRTQLRHQAGGTWDEWYAAFTDGRWGWLAEAAGRYYLTFQKKAQNVPAYEDLELDGKLGKYTVAEIGEAKAIAAEGEIPYRFVPGSVYDYADLSGPNGEFGTLDYSEDEPLLYTGKEVTLDDLGVPAKVKPILSHEMRQVEGAQLSCPNCGAGLSLQAPDEAERVTCRSCNSLLDINQGKLNFLKALEASDIEPVLALGSTGELQGTKYVVIGFVVRVVHIEGIDYFWEEYLLYNKRIGFRWLVRSDDHWNYVEPLAPGSVEKTGKNAFWEGKTFKLFQRADAYVVHVLGEFYWKVEVGEAVRASDYICPPHIISREVTYQEDSDERGEVNWSHGTYLPVADVEQAFGVEGLPRPAFSNVAPTQVFGQKRVYLYWAILATAAVLLFIFVNIVSPRRKVYEKTFPAFVPTPNTEQAAVLIEEDKDFQLKGWNNVRVTITATGLDNDWLEVEGDLINKDTDEIQPFAAELGYFHGVEDGESWTEDSREESVYVSSPPSGTYLLRLEAIGDRDRTIQTGGVPPIVRPGGQGGQGSQVTLHVVVEQGVPRFWPWFITFVVISIVPIGVVIYHIWFEKRRWYGSSIE
jgi:hypothetical protein